MKKISLFVFAALLLLWAGLSGGFTFGIDMLNELNTKMSNNANSFSTRTQNSVLQQAAAEAPEDALLYIVNAPNDEELSEIISYQLIQLDDGAPLTLLAPANKGTKMRLYLTDGDGNRAGELWTTESSDKGLVLAAYLNYGAKGAPTYELYLEYGKHYASYFFEQDADSPNEKFAYTTPQGELLSTGGLD